jgi:hypothetical protein
MRELYVIETGVSNDPQGQDFQFGTLIIQVNTDTLNNEFIVVLTILKQSKLSDDIQKNTFLMIIVQSIPVAAIMCGFAWFIAFYILRQLSIPVADLYYKLMLLGKDTLTIQIYSNYRPSARDINNLYEAFHSLITVLNFANPRYFEGNDADLIIRYSEGLILFEKIKSNRGIGLNLTNIGHIHRKHKRY